MEPAGEKISPIIRETFELLDANEDNLVSLEEITSQHSFTLDPWQSGHQQIHIGFTEKHDEMQVMWVSNPVNY